MASKSPVNEVLRNPRRVLNHLDLVHRKLAVAKRWNLTGKGCDPEIQDCLLVLQQRRSDVVDVIRRIAKHNRQNPDALLADLLECYGTGLLEFHPTDVCDLNCVDCHYRSKSNATFSFGEISHLVRDLSPRAITITGGGEPGVYRDAGHTLNDVIEGIVSAAPNAGLGLINNNTHIPSGDWPKYIAWQRTSIDACTRDTYLTLKRTDRFCQAIANVDKLIHATDIPFVGIGFLYRSENVLELRDFVHYWHTWFEKLPDHFRRRFNLQFRPISAAIQEMNTVREGAQKVVPPAIEEELRHQLAALDVDARADPRFSAFVSEQTNLASVRPAFNGVTSYFVHRPVPFNNCYNALVHRVVRANGDQYPDFLLCDFPEFSLGNTVTDSSLEERARIALMQFFFFNRRGRFCRAECCRQGWVSSLCEGGVANSSGTTVIDGGPPDYFF